MSNFENFLKANAPSIKEINHSISKGINSFLDTIYLSIIVLCLVKLDLFTTTSPIYNSIANGAMIAAASTVWDVGSAPIVGATVNVKHIVLFHLQWNRLS